MDNFVKKLHDKANALITEAMDLRCCGNCVNFNRVSHVGHPSCSLGHSDDGFPWTVCEEWSYDKLTTTERLIKPVTYKTEGA
jgi:hypothetical protein